MDAAVTGDPLWSMHLTQEASDELYGRYTRLDNLGFAGADVLNVAGPFALLAAPFALARRVRDRTGPLLLVWSLLAVSCGLFLLLVARGMASSERYLLVPTCLIAVLAGVAAVRWREFPGAVVVGVMSVLALGLLIRGDGIVSVRYEIRPHARWVSETRELAERPDVRAMLATCPDVAVSGKLVPGWAFWGDRPLDRWQLDERGATRPELYVAPASADVAARMLTRKRFDADSGFELPPGLAAGPATASWRLHVAPSAGCVAAA